MCKGKACRCQKHGAAKINGAVRTENFEGRAHLVVPVIMARADTPMNEGLIPEEEMVPHAWNGVPVTIGHPRGSDGGSLEANSPRVLEEWHCGRIFNARVVAGVLKGEAWIDIAKANALRPSLIQQLRAQAKMDVSTGYFCDSEVAEGVSNGKRFKELHRNLRPEHLALLPDEEGACNFADGCGVRSNKEKSPMKLKDALKALNQVSRLLKAKAKTNERGDDDDFRQMVADMISNDGSPFTPEDEDSLRMMSPKSLQKLRDQYLKKQEDDEEKAENTGDESDDKAENEDDTDDETVDNEDDEEKKDMKGKKNAAGKKAQNTVKVDVSELTEVLADIKTVVNSMAKNILSDEDRELLKALRQNRADTRAEKIEIVHNAHGIAKKKLMAMDDETLDVLANSAIPASYGGRAMPRTNDKADDIVKGMTENIGSKAEVARINAHRKAA